MTLDGVAVVEVASFLPGPFAGARLAGLGADVVKVEPPGGDPTEDWSPTAYEALNDAKTVVELDLTGPDRDRFRDRVVDADVVVTAHRPSTLEKLQLTADDLHAAADGLVVVQLFGHGDRERAGHDLTYQARGGLAGPDAPVTPVADLAAGERVATEAVAGLFHRERTGEPSTRAVVAESVARDWADAARPIADVLAGHPGYDVYACRSGHLAVACLEDRHWERLCSRLDEPGWVDRPDGVADALADRLGQRPVEDWLAELDGLPVAGLADS